MTVKSLRRRKRLRRKEALLFKERLEAALGTSPFSPEDQVDRAAAGDFDLLLVEGAAVAMIHEGEPFLTVRGLLKNPGIRRYVTVDMGAVPHVSNGADVMAPGIVDADPDIEEGHLVWVRDEKNMVPLAVGRALLSASEMVSADRGRAIHTLHHVGDWIWEVGES